MNDLKRDKMKRFEKDISIDDYAKDGSGEHFTNMHCVRITNT